MPLSEWKTFSRVLHGGVQDQNPGGGHGVEPPEAEVFCNLYVKVRISNLCKEIRKMKKKYI